MKSIIELLNRTVKSFPERDAFADETDHFNWKETEQISKAIATCLIEKEAYKKSVLLYFGRSAKCPVAMMGVLRAGGFYTVLDVDQPLDRVDIITSQLKSQIIITDREHEENARKIAPICLLFEDMVGTQINEQGLEAIFHKMLSTDLAYVLFTSGSTGVPKGVALTHKNVIAYSKWFVETFDITENTVFGGQTPFYFSMSVSDVYGCIRSGASLQTIPKRYFGFPAQLIEYVKEKNVNTIYWVPSALGFVANWDVFNYVEPPKLDKILFAGESMPCSKMNYWRKFYPNALFANLFGPTETTDICAYYIVNRDFADDAALPIGIPCDNCGLLVLDENDKEVLGDEEGELCAKGDFLAVGYYGMPDKTAERFVMNPLEKNYDEIIYRTGDLVKYNAFGELEFCGRKDNQIKHRGYRIELGEIDTVASSVPNLQECVTIFDEKEDRILLAFTASKKIEDLLKETIEKKLPAYMVPSEFVRLKMMPHNANGKIDRKVVKELIKEK